MVCSPQGLLDEQQENRHGRDLKQDVHRRCSLWRRTVSPAENTPFSKEGGNQKIQGVANVGLRNDARRASIQRKRKRPRFVTRRQPFGEGARSRFAAKTSACAEMKRVAR
jgi:hypothetical protein